jgi:hypothetical protein
MLKKQQYHLLGAEWGVLNLLGAEWGVLNLLGPNAESPTCDAVDLIR